MSAISVITPDWPAPSNVRAAVTTRTGGVSRAPYDSLNLAGHVGDAADAVATNRQRLAQYLSLPAQPVWLQQVHGVAVLRQDGANTPDIAAPYDASYSCLPNTVCAVLTADCLPVLFCSRDGCEVAAAHAGWRGLADGVLQTTIENFSCSRADIMAWLGPAIGPASFEVGEEVCQQFIARWRDIPERAIAACFTQKDVSHWFCDIYALARLQLQSLGISAVYGGGEDTCRDAARFYSFRREGDTGRMATLVWKAEQ